MFHDLILQMNALVYPLIGLVSFLFAFGVAVVRALRAPRQTLDERARLPLEDN